MKSYQQFQLPAIGLFVQYFVKMSNKEDIKAQPVQANDKENIKLHVIGPFQGNLTLTGGFPSQKASKAELWYHNIIANKYHV